jgi:hypothetical protein
VNLDSLGLTAEELDTVNQFNERFAQRRHRITAETLLATWIALIQEVESGYAGSIDDYANDLASRDHLQELIRIAQPSLRSKLEEVLEPWDERFRASTTDDGGRALSRFFNIKDGWWWQRAPREGQLADYLRERTR